MIYHCLFEQSGTFKNVFKKFGHESYDYDILDDYGQTDYKIDLFNEINNAWDKLVNGVSINTIFDKMSPGKDFIIAFFPCTYFSSQNELLFKCLGYNNKNELSKDNLLNIINREYQRAAYYEYFIKFCYIVEKLNIPTIIENPYCMGGRNYLNLYSPYRPSYVDMNRSLFGDDKIKSTMYFAINFEMDEKFIMYTQMVTTKSVHKLSQRQRSEITPLYAENFYRRFLEKVV